MGCPLVASLPGARSFNFPQTKSQSPPDGLWRAAYDNTPPPLDVLVPTFFGRHGRRWLCLSCCCSLSAWGHISSLTRDQPLKAKRELRLKCMQRAHSSSAGLPACVIVFESRPIKVIIMCSRRKLNFAVITAPPPAPLLVALLVTMFCLAVRCFGFVCAAAGQCSVKT